MHYYRGFRILAELFRTKNREMGDVEKLFSKKVNWKKVRGWFIEMILYNDEGATHAKDGTLLKWSFAKLKIFRALHLGRQ